jgi:putative nucleotidyltransferase with HDIG domain
MVARAAYKIAVKAGLPDPELAYMCGLYHDVGKLYLSRDKKYRHPLLGHKIMNESGRPAVAKTCLTHPFPCIDEEYITFYCHGDIVESNNIRRLLEAQEFDIYDQLIQLCDKVSRVDSYVTVEHKFDLYAKKYQVFDAFIERSHMAFYDIKKMFDSLIGDDVYSFLGVSE